MSEHGQSATGVGGDVDLTQFYQVFFEEAGENLASMESLLLAIEIDNPVDDDLHAVFRAAHSIKGGAATFGFQNVAELTHELETLLDRVRKHELPLTTEMINTLLEAGDVLRAQLASHQAGDGDDGNDISGLLFHVRQLAAGEAAAKPAEKQQRYAMRIGPVSDPGIFNGIAELFTDIPGLGTLTPLDQGVTDGVRQFEVATASSAEELCNLLGFHVSPEQISLTLLPEPAGAGANAAAQPVADPGFGLFDEPAVTVAPAPVEKRQTDRRQAADATTLRVAVEKVDQLINLVGELVITQAMLTNHAHNIDPIAHSGLLAGLADLERGTRSLQESVMGIRMIPMAAVFSRFPRMLRDLAAKLGKEVELKTSGESTELDKGLIEKITDPLTHLIRNSLDHGIESPSERLAAGKPARGTIFLSAKHQGGSIVIEVRDDGAGFNRGKILAKAKQQGLPAHDGMSDQEVWQLMWAPGFSTAEKVTDVSGRGVGMDVVKKNISSLSGTVELDSAQGQGSRVSVRLPLTLAIMDGMSVGVNGGVFIVPLANVVESMQVDPALLRSVVGEGTVVEVRDEFLPVVSLREVFKVAAKPSAQPSRILVIVESEGARAALMVDQLIGQHQVVVKNLEANYRKVPGASGATIMGDGRVALILDVGRIVSTCSTQSATDPVPPTRH